MTFGLYSKGDYSQMIISSEANTLAYVGKATFVSRAGWIEPGRAPYYYTDGSVVLYNFPICSIYRYTFNAGGRDVVFFQYSPYPQKSSLIIATKGGDGTYDLSIASQPAGPTSFIPTVYCFAKTNTASSSGYGMNVWKADSSIAFSTAEKALIVKKYYTGTFQASNLTPMYSREQLSYVGNGPNQYATTISYIPPVDSIAQTISKPILYLPSYQTAGARAPQSSYQVYELLGAYNPSTTNLEVEWVSPAFGGFNPTTYQTNARTGFAMVADGADYD
jgi:hypothetical protein